jgi:predicted DNA-binding protein YlxM (UPF0122 family)
MNQNDNLNPQSLKDKMNALGITHKEIANNLGVSVQSIYNLVSGRTNKQSLMYKTLDFLNQYKRQDNLGDFIIEDFCNVTFYSQCSSILCSCLAKKGVLQLEYKILLLLMRKIYSFVLNNKQNNDMLELYVNGLIDGYIDSNLIKKDCA